MSELKRMRGWTASEGKKFKKRIFKNFDKNVSARDLLQHIYIFSGFHGNGSLVNILAKI